MRKTGVGTVGGVKTCSHGPVLLGGADSCLLLLSELNVLSLLSFVPVGNKKGARRNLRSALPAN